MTRPIRFLAVFAAVLFALAPAVQATYSIVVINRRTGEVGVAVTTCIGGGFRLDRAVPVILVGKGAAAAQSFIDTNGRNRERIADSMALNLTPAEILAALEAGDGGHQTRQYGIVSIDGPPVAFTGTSAGFGRYDVVGSLDGEIPGEWEYAIQGNVLTSDLVVIDGERAFRACQGDTLQKMLAAMDAMRALGGDGRCSCSGPAPDSCGAPPPNFTQSGYTSWIGLARIGDTDGTTCNALGCATGDYFLERRFRMGDTTGEDATTVLIRRCRVWRENLRGLPDQVHTEVSMDLPRLIAGDDQRALVTVRLRDIEDEALTAGGQMFTVTRTGGEPLATAGTVIDNGDGTHTFEIIPTASGPASPGPMPGTAEFTIVVEAPGERPVQLHPALSVEFVDATDLHSGLETFDASSSAELGLVVRRPADAGRAYRIYGSLSGTSPGTALPCATLPLNRDRFFDYTASAAGLEPFQGSVGVLDAGGRARATLDLPAGILAPLIGADLSFCAVVMDAASCDTTDVVTVPIR